MEDFKKCNSFSEMGRCLGYDYYNGYVKTEIIKFCQNNNIDPYEIIKQNKTPNKCLYCGKELEGKDRFRKKFCNSSCAASYNNKKRGPISVETRRKISDSLIIYNEGFTRKMESIFGEDLKKCDIVSRYKYENMGTFSKLKCISCKLQSWNAFNTFKLFFSQISSTF